MLNCLPDWKDPAKYPGPGTAHIRWAWEFLRRSPDYQRDQAAVAAGDANALARLPELLRHYRLQGHLPDPCLSGPDFTPPFYSPAVEYVGYDGPDPYGPVTEILWKHEILVRIDLGTDLDLQLERVKRAVLEEFKDMPKKGDRRTRVEMYRDYLRVLDANAAGVKPPEIAEHLFGDELKDKLAGSYLTKARKFQNGDYHYLIRQVDW